MFRSGLKRMLLPGVESRDIRARAGVSRNGLEEMALTKRDLRRMGVGSPDRGATGTFDKASLLIVLIVEQSRVPRR